MKPKKDNNKIFKSHIQAWTKFELLMTIIGLFAIVLMWPNENVKWITSAILIIRIYLLSKVSYFGWWNTEL